MRPQPLQSQLLNQAHALPPALPQQWLLQLPQAPLQGLLHPHLQQKVGYGQILTLKFLHPSSIAQLALMPSLEFTGTQRRSQFHGIKTHYLGGKRMSQHFPL